MLAIAVEQPAQRQGYGRHLLAFVEAEVRRRGGRLLLMESRAQESGDRAAGFFERTGYTQVARIPGFYRPGEDKLVWSKELEPIS